MNKTVTTKAGTYGLRDGSEGPKHDPYSYREYLFTPKDEEKPPIRLHGGLMEFLYIGENKIVAEWKVLVTKFTESVGMDPDAVEKLVERPQYDPMRGKRLSISLTVNDVRWIIRGLNFAYSKTKNRVLRMTLNRITFAIGHAACEANGDHIMMHTDSNITPDSGSEYFGCDACGWSQDIHYY